MLNPGPAYIGIWLPIIIVVLVIFIPVAYFLYKRKETTRIDKPGVISTGYIDNNGSSASMEHTDQNSESSKANDSLQTNLDQPIPVGSSQTISDQPKQNDSPQTNLNKLKQDESPQPIQNGSPQNPTGPPQQPIIQSKSPNRTYKYRILSQCLMLPIKDRVEINFIEYMDPNATNIFILYNVDRTMIQSLSDYVTQNLSEYEIIYHNIKADYYTCMIIQKGIYPIGGDSFYIRSTSYISNVINDSNIAVSGIDCIAPHNNCNSYDKLINQYRRSVIGSKYISVDPDELDNTFRDNNLYYKSNGKKGAISIINNKNKDVKISVINMNNNTNYSDILVAEYNITV